MTAAATLSLIGIPTRDRTECLWHCLLSHIASAELHHRHCEFVVVDDSADESLQQKHREQLHSLRQQHDCQITLIGPREKQHAVTTISKTIGSSADVLAFALLNPCQLPIATGASRNALLLHAAGELLLQVDDDTEARLAFMPSTTPDVVATPRFDPTEFWFLSEAELAQISGSLAAGDLVGLHEQWLGQPRLDGRVLASMAGVVGDSGMGSSLYFLNLHGASRDRLLVSEACYRSALYQHRVLRGVQQPTLAAGAVCMSLNLGLDHRALLPPFFPVQRNQDGVFGALLRTCCAGALFAYLPRAVLHLPPQPRVRTLDAIEAEVGRLSSGQVVQSLIWTLGSAAPGSYTAANLRAVGAALYKLGTLPLPSFTALTSRLVRKQLENLASQWEGGLEQHHDQPAFWAADMRRLLAILRTRLTGNELAAPIDLVRCAGATQAVPMLQKLLMRFGQLLESWPAIVDAARDLRSRGALWHRRHSQGAEPS